MKKNSLRSGIALVLTTAACNGFGGPGSFGLQPGAASRTSPAQDEALLYVSDVGNNVVRMYSYPQLVAAGLIKVRDPEGLCVDTRTQNVWVVSTAYSKIVEFAHGGTTPIATLADGVEYPQACAVDPLTRNLAVANLDDQGSDPGSVSIYEKARGRAHLYSDPNVYFVSFVAYDGEGNLFVDGSAQTWPQFRLAELPRGARKFKDLTLSGGRIKTPGGMVYHRGVLAIADQRRSIIYQTSSGRITGRTQLQGACYVTQFVTIDKRAIVANTCGSARNPTGNVLIYDYPRGGSPIKQLGGLRVAFGVALSR
jgi:DNA-binding beta-propeller fold protein YncE